MAIRRIESVALPYAGKRHTPNTGALAALYTRGGDALAEISLRKGAASAQLFERLGQIFTGYQQMEREKQSTAASLALRAQEKADERAFTSEQARLEREARVAERKIDKSDRATEREAATLERTIGDMPPGVVSPALLAQVQRLSPVLASRFRSTETLPARVTPGAAGEVAAEPEALTILEPTAAQGRQAAIDTAQRERWAAEDAARTRDDVRADTQLGLTRENQRVTQENARIMQGIAQQNADTTRANSQARIGGGTSDLTPVYRNALERVLSSIPANRRGPKITHANRLFEEQNEKELKDFIRLNAIESEPVDIRQQITGRMATLASLRDTRDVLREMKAAGVPTNIMSGSVEDVARKLGTSTDPRYVAMSNRLAGTLINYRRAATGVAFGEREGAAYEKMFPNYRNTLPVNEALLDGLEREMTTYDKTYWEHKLGNDGAALVIGAAPAVRVLSITPVKE